MPRATRSSQSQTLSQVNYNEQSQTQISDEEKAKRIEEAATKLVSFVLHNMDNKKILRQTAIQKHVAVKGVQINTQMKAANKRLNEIYGCELTPIEDPSVKVPSYYIKKITPHLNLSDQNEEANRKKIITFLIMTIVFMSNGQCSDKHLLEVIQKLNIVDEDYVQNLLKDLTSGRMVEIVNETVSFGPLAEVLVNKMEILEFVSKVYGTRVNSWGELHSQAVEQEDISKMGEDDNENEDNANGDCEVVAGPSQKSKGRH